jgi:aldose 1-epimerase
MPDGTLVHEFVLENSTYHAEIITYGGILTRLVAHGVDVVMGFATLEDYLKDISHQGALVGRVANRIAKGRFTLDGVTYDLARNAGGGTVHLHGGNIGYSRKVWQVVNIGDNSLTLRMVSPDKDENYPGNLLADVTYTLTEEGLVIDYRAETDARTPINLTNHAYFNLDGCKGDSILPYIAYLDADYYSELDEDLVPKEKVAVCGNRYDFTTPHAIGLYMPNEGDSYDNNYFLNHTKTYEVAGHTLPLAATVENDSLRFSLYTDQPCVQFYIGNCLYDDLPFRDGVPQIPHTTFCLEAQIVPDAPNHGMGILSPGEVYRQTTIYKFDKK